MSMSIIKNKFLLKINENQNVIFMGYLKTEWKIWTFILNCLLFFHIKTDLLNVFKSSNVLKSKHNHSKSAD